MVRFIYLLAYLLTFVLKGKVHLYSAASRMCRLIGAVSQTEPAFSLGGRPKPTLTDFGLQPYSRTWLLSACLYFLP